ncbi:MAG: hypothetical protein ACR2NR_14980 [Solirubrobacteraceae bacterium]
MDATTTVGHRIGEVTTTVRHRIGEPATTVGERVGGAAATVWIVWATRTRRDGVRYRAILTDQSVGHGSPGPPTQENPSLRAGAIQFNATEDPDRHRDTAGRPLHRGRA